MPEEGFFTRVIEVMQRMGFFEVILPFLLVFAVVYGALEKTKVFGEEKRDINAIIAFVVGMIVISTTWVTAVLTELFLPWVGFLGVVIICFLLLVALFWGEVSELQKHKWVRGGGIAAVCIIFLLVLLRALPPETGFYYPGITEEDLAVVVMMIILIAAIGLITKAPRKEK
jgi:hypothetical protein